MKKIISFILVLSMILVLVACGANTDPETTTTAATTTAATVATTTTAATEATTEATTAATTTTATTTTATTPAVTEPPAPEYPAAIKTAEDFANMNADGEYYLAADITITGTWTAGKALSATYADNAEFTGILDGKGHTITTTTALFANFAGTVKDLTIVGEIPEVKVGDTVMHGAAVAMWTSGTAHFENVTNKANITGGNSSGAMLGYGKTGADITAIGCVNYGDINCVNQIGGIIGYIQGNKAKIENCTNYGDLVTTNYGAGIIGRFGSDAATAADSSVVITGCANYGRVESGKGQTGGILGYLISYAEIDNCVNHGEIVNNTVMAGGIFGAVGNKKEQCGLKITNCVNYGKVQGATLVGGIAGQHGKALQHSAVTFRIENCVNHGDVYAISPASATATVQVAGIAGYAYSGSPVANAVINCVNLGDVYADNQGTGKAYVGGIIGYTNGTNYEAQNNINAGQLHFTGNGLTSMALTLYNKNAESALTANNYTLAQGDIASCQISDPPTASPEKGIIVTAEQMASGEVAYLLNQAIGSTVFYQKIGIDAVPTLTKSDDGIVYKWENGMYANIASATPINTAEEFAAMTADGNYYLAKDITIKATWNGGKDVSATYADNTAFTGTLLGNGHTITVSAPLFANFQGVIKDLTIKGNITENKIGDTVVHGGAVSRWTNGKAVFANIVSKVNITGSKSTGALVGYGATGSDLLAVNCVNDGAFDCSDQVGGLFGYVQDTKVTIINCVNNGNLKTANYGGGIIGRFGRDAADIANGSLVTIIECVNNGKVVSAKGQTGGILGYLIGGAEIYDCVNNGEIVNETAQSGGIFGSTGDKDKTTAVYIEGCSNNGVIKGVTYVGGIAARVGRANQSPAGNYRLVDCVNYGEVQATAQKDASIYAAGIAGYAWGGGISAGHDPNGLVGNVNYGKVVVDATAVTSKANYIGGITGYVNSSNYEIKDNINVGAISVKGGANNSIALIAYNKNIASVENGMFANNYALAAGDTVVAYAGDGEAKAPVAESAAVAFTADQLAKGEVAYLKDIGFALK